MGWEYVLLFIALLSAPISGHESDYQWSDPQRDFLEKNNWSASPTLRNAGELTPPVLGGKSYFALFGGYEAPNPARPEELSTHTFAVFSSLEDPADTFTISWLPVRLGKSPGNIIKRSGVSEYGKNFSFEHTLVLSRLPTRKLLRWGPYRITPEFYRKAHYQYAYLERFRSHELSDSELQAQLGTPDPPTRVHYQVLDGSSRAATYANKLNDLRSQYESTRDPFYLSLFNELVKTLPVLSTLQPFSGVHCIHAVSDIESYLKTLMERGFVATHLAFSSFAQTTNVAANFVGFNYQEESVDALEILQARLDQTQIHRFGSLYGVAAEDFDLRTTPIARLAYPGKYRNSLILGPARAFSEVWNTREWR